MAKTIEPPRLRRAVFNSAHVKEGGPPSVDYEFVDGTHARCSLTTDTKFPWIAPIVMLAHIDELPYPTMRLVTTISPYGKPIELDSLHLSDDPQLVNLALDASSRYDADKLSDSTVLFAAED